MAFHTLSVYSVLVAIIIDRVSSVVVHTENGKIKGTKFTTFQGRVLDAFLGIPYAKPPTEKNRFKDPQPAEKWEGIRSADVHGSECIQITFDRNLPDWVGGDEDCLFLNIYTPSVSTFSRLNVIMYIHGGAFMVFSGNRYNPYYILDHGDFVFVSINYRLGPFGFLSTEDVVVPGNFGLKDQVMALKWIRDNIEHFGGDKEKITLAGLSAGGASVHLHYLSPLSKDLFKNGISESGSALDPWALTENPLEKAKTLSAAVGCPTNTSKDILECLQKKDAVSILGQIQRLFIPWEYSPFSPFGPVVEPQSSAAFLSKQPYRIIADGEVKNAPWMTYITTDEGLWPAASFIAKNNKMEELDQYWDAIAPHLLDYNYTVAQEFKSEVSQKIRRFYLGERRINKESRANLVKLMSDRLFGIGAEKSVRLQASVSKSPVYFFVFGYRGSSSISEGLCSCKENFGVSHADNVLYQFQPLGIKSEQDNITAKNMITIWTSFAFNSVPFVSGNLFIPAVSPDIGEVGNLTYFLFGSQHEIKVTADLTNRKFWDGLSILENEKANYFTVSKASIKINS